MDKLTTAEELLVLIYMACPIDRCPASLNQYVFTCFKKHGVCMEVAVDAIRQWLIKVRQYPVDAIPENIAVD